MIDVVRAIAAAAAVDTPVSIDVADAQNAPISRSSGRFQIGNAFAGVFRDLSTTFERNCGETAFAVNW